MTNPLPSRFWLNLQTCVVIAMAAINPLSAEEAMKNRIDRLAQPYLDGQLVVGMTVGVLHNGETTVVGYGRLSQEEDRLPDGDTVYEIGSMTKVFTGVLLADAVTRGRVKLDQPVQELLPKQVAMPTGGTRPITLRDLATHVSGLPPLPGNFRPADKANPYADYTVDQMYSFLKSHKPGRSPGEKYEYW